MLPVYTSSDVVHFRHGTAHMPTARTPTASSAWRPSRRRAARVFLQIAGALVLLVASLSLASGIWRFGTLSPAGSISGLTRNRRMLDGAELARSFLPASPLRNLVLVAGHAVYVGSDYAMAANESVWFLEDYQKVPGEAQSFLDHIRLGVEQAAQDPSALLLFSGGQTRRAAGPRSEGLSYWVVAEAAGWFGLPEVRNRTFTEEHARDSFENLLFGLCRFFELTGHYPEDVTVVSYTLKQDRFSTLHRGALRFPVQHFHFVGTEVPPAAIRAQAGEQQTVAAFQKDPYGCTGDLLLKRLRRDPFAVGPPHPSRCPALHGLLRHCQPKVYAGPLPWQHTTHDSD